MTGKIHRLDGALVEDRDVLTADPKVAAALETLKALNEDGKIDALLTVYSGLAGWEASWVWSGRPNPEIAMRAVGMLEALKHELLAAMVNAESPAAP